MRTADSAFKKGGLEGKRHDLSRVLRPRGVRFSTTLAPHQPEAFVGDSLKFDLSAVKKISESFSGHFIFPSG